MSLSDIKLWLQIQNDIVIGIDDKQTILTPNEAMQLCGQLQALVYSKALRDKLEWTEKALQLCAEKHKPSKRNMDNNPEYWRAIAGKEIYDRLKR